MPKRAINYKTLVVNLVNYFELEKKNGGPLVPILQVHRRASDALQISFQTISRILKGDKTGTLTKKNERKKQVKKKSENIYDTDKMEIRNIIYRMYLEKKYVNLDSIHKEVNHKIDISRTSLFRTLKCIGFRFRKDCNRRALCEKSSVILLRTQFLRAYEEFSKQSFKFVFLDETWIFAHGGCKSSWQDNNVKSVKKTTSNGKRYIVLHAGTEDGFVRDASLIFSSTSKSSDYHDNMNIDLFEKWITNHLLINLSEPSVIIMDNASYHSGLVNKQPNSSWKKADIEQWLQHEKIPISQNLLKAELLEIARQFKKPNEYKIDQIVHSYGHQILRLPPYHCQFNAIEQIWGICKNYFDRHMGRDGYGNQKSLDMWKEALGTVTPEVWASCVSHTDKLIKEWWCREKLIQTNMEPFVIGLRDDSDESFNSSIDFASDS